MKHYEYLEAALAVIVTPDKWIKNAYAVDHLDNELEGGMFAKACKFCAVGALERATGLPDGSELMCQLIRYLDRNVGVLYDESIADFNDDWDTTHKDIVEVFKLAIEDAKRNEV